MEPNLEMVVTQPTKNSAVVELEGELEFCTCPKVRNTFSRLLCNGTERIAIDLSKVIFMGEDGVACILEVYAIVTKAHGALILVLNEKSQAVAKLTTIGIDKLPIHLFYSQPDALAKLVGLRTKEAAV